MRFGVVGSSGRMGREVVRIFSEAGHDLVLSVDEKSRDITGVPEVILDFSLPAGLPVSIALSREYGCGLIVGSTGLSDEQVEELRQLGESCAVVHSSNFGIGINLLSMILDDYREQFAGWDMEIVETHHDKKRDAPSGSALMLAAATGRDFPLERMHSLRLGNLPGDHAVHMSNGDELIVLSHRLVNRAALAAGALRAAEFARSAPAGYYTFRDVLRTKK